MVKWDDYPPTYPMRNYQLKEGLYLAGSTVNEPP